MIDHEEVPLFVNKLLEVKDLEVQFKMNGQTIKAVDRVSYHVNKGEIVALVGESGSGKSVSQYSLIQLIPSPPGKIVNGQVIFDGEDLLKLKPNSNQLRRVRGGKIGVIFQEPMTSLNPVLTVGEQIMESIMLHTHVMRSQAKNRAIELLKMVGIPDPEYRINQYPHQFSGGMRQRIMIAMAMSCNPKLLIADEATTALDVTTQAQILELLRDIVKKTDTSIILVTHNLGIVARYADRIYVMYAGEIVESGPCKEIFRNPRHPYTVGLLNAIPRLDDPKDRQLIPIDGFPPNLAFKPETCPFLERCIYRIDRCSTLPAPPLTNVGEDHFAACYIDISKQETLVNKPVVKQDPQDPSDKPIKPGSFDHVSKTSREVMLEVQNLKMYFQVSKGLWQRKTIKIKAVDDVSFKIFKGETLGLVGESGCGKTTVARCILRMYEPTGGKIILDGTDITKMDRRQLRPFRKNMSLIFQDPFSSLNPRLNAASIVGEPLIINKQTTNSEEYHKRVDELFRLVGLDPQLKNRMPHEFSGGQRQRLGIARALASNPPFIVCDEAISALDVSIQAQIINLLVDLQRKLGLTYLFIAHDLSVIRHIADRVAVMYLGRIVEIGDWRSIYENPLHPYTQALLAAVPIPDPFVEEKRNRLVIKGEVPSLIDMPPGCPFSNRCPIASDECKKSIPPLVEVESGHSVACLKV